MSPKVAATIAERIIETTMSEIGRQRGDDGDYKHPNVRNLRDAVVRELIAAAAEAVATQPVVQKRPGYRGVLCTNCNGEFYVPDTEPIRTTLCGMCRPGG
jgi:hypothetical protein